MKRGFLVFLLFTTSTSVIAQTDRALLQSMGNAGGSTGSFHPSSSIPTHFSSIGQPMVLPRLSATNSGGGVMNANNVMFSASTQPSEPTIQAREVVITQPFVNTLQVSWTNGNGSSRLVVAKQGGVVDQAPIDGTTYLASSSFTSGDDLGGGNYVVYNGTGNTVTVTDIQSGVTYNFFVFEYNGNGGTENYNISTASNNPKSTSPSDATPPTLVIDNTPTSVSPGNSIVVSARFADAESAVSGVVLEYRSVSAGGNFINPPMVFNAPNWESTIQAADVVDLGIEYRMVATSGGGTLTTPLRNVKVAHDNILGLTVPYNSFGDQQSNYRIVSVPLELSSNSLASVFGTHLGAYDGKAWRMFRWQNGATTELNSNSIIEPGKGYWLIIRENKGISLSSGAGTTVQTNSENPFTLQNISPEWYQVGNPYPFNLLWEDVRAANPGLPGLRTFEGAFSDATVLKAFSGGFFKLAAGGSPIDLKFPVVKNASAGRKIEHRLNALDRPNWQVNLVLTQGQFVNTMAGIGMHQEASDGFDVFDGFTMPRIFEDFIEVNHNKKDGNSPFTNDVVPTQSNHIWEFSIATTHADPLMTFSWDNSYFGNSDRELYWMDVGTGRSFDMRAISSYVFNKNVSGPFKIIYGDKSFVQENIHVDRLIMHNPYPIPFDEEVTIAFSLPGSVDTMASVEVIDLLGKRIWIKEALFSAGYNEVKWKRSGETSGIYLARIVSGRLTQQTRLIIR